MQAQPKHEFAHSDLNAVREFLLNGREIPPGLRPGRRPNRSQVVVPMHNGIVRVRSRSLAKG